MSRIKKGRLRRKSDLMSDDVNPMEGAINIVDAMLVFACGLMLSLVIYWNVDLRSGSMVPVSQGAEVTAGEQVPDIADAENPDSGLEEVGKVYRDPQTGNLYLAQDETTGQAVSEDGNE